MILENVRPRSAIGAVPGSLIRHEFASESRARLIEFNRQFIEDRQLDSLDALCAEAMQKVVLAARIRPRRSVQMASMVAERSDLFSERPVADRSISWINIDGLANVDMLRQLGKKYGLHALALEDVVNLNQRAKTETYDNNIFLVVRMPREGDRFTTEQVSLFLLDGVVITLQEYAGDCLNPVRERLAGSKGRIRSRGADYLAYAIIDAVIDGYFPVLDRYDAILRQVSDEIAGQSPADIPRRLHDIRADLLSIRKIAQQHQDALTLLLREESKLITEQTVPFLRDCLDHITRLIEAADTYRETCGELRELYFAQLGQKTNDVMKVLTIIATVFIPMSFIAGVYGMNFDSEVSSLNMPELHWAFGYPFAILVMLSTGGGLLFYLRRKGWL